jgi:hypothetical protein
MSTSQGSKDGLYVIGHKKCIDDLNRSNGKFLQKFQSEYLRSCRHLTAPVDCHWYQPGQVNVHQEGDNEPELSDIEEEPEEKDLESQTRHRLAIYTGRTFDKGAVLTRAGVAISCSASSFIFKSLL